jgi:hypothetical protein
VSDDLLQPWIELEWLRVEKLNALELRMSRIQDVDSLLGDDSGINAQDGGAWKPFQGEVASLEFGNWTSVFSLVTKTRSCGMRIGVST